MFSESIKEIFSYVYLWMFPWLYKHYGDITVIVNNCTYMFIKFNQIR